MSKTCIFTIVSRNYMHYARTLMDSVAQYAPDADRVVGLCDKPGDFDFSGDNFEILEMASLPVPDIEKFIFRYTILELNTAIKPYVISALFAQGYEKVIYFDPDIRVYRSLDQMLSLLDEHQMLLTPHLTGPLDDDKMPAELTILVSGSYNLGYIGLRNTPEMQQFAHWWEDKLHKDCVVDLERGLFVDQKWMDLVPGMYSGVFINRNPGWNVAYWNLKHRSVSEADGEFTVNGEPLQFFHYSGFSGAAKTLSKHQDRYTKQSAGPAVEKLCGGYASMLEANGMAETSRIPYAYGTFADGTPIPDFARYIYREDYDWENSTDDPYKDDGCANYLGYLNEPITINGRVLPWITRLGLKLYDARPDLQAAFPDLAGSHGKRFADWYIQSAAEQAGFDECFIKPVRHGLNQMGESEPNAPILERVRSAINRKLYQFAWRYRHLIRPFVPERMRQRVHVRLVEQLTSSSNNNPEPVGRGEKDPTLPWGINLFGYVNAESGIGQSARGNIHNIQARNLPLAVIDFREGNVSRMDAAVPQELMGEPRFNINLFHINADQTVYAINHLGADILKGRYNIGYWAWELPEFPDEWLPAMQMLDEIWVPSEFCRQAIAAKADIPVVCIPHSIEQIENLAPASRQGFGLPDGNVLFLSMFDALSQPERKNPEAAIEAFQGAVDAGHTNAHLVLKVSNLDKTPDFAEQLRLMVAANDSITLIEGYLAREDVFRLIGVCDVFLSLHRSEGFGLGLAEAMLMGKVTLATNWSGNLQFMNADNSMPVGFELVKLEADHGPYKAGQVWAEPDLAEAAQQIGLLCTNPQHLASLGAKAQQRILEDFSPAAIGLQIEQRLAAIGELDQALARPGD